MLPDSFTSLFFLIFNWGLFLLGIFSFLRIYSSPYGYCRDISFDLFPWGAFIICLACAIYWGIRPINDNFADTLGYSNWYYFYKSGDFAMHWESEWGWKILMLICFKLNFSSSEWFLAIDMIQMMALFYGCKRLFGDKAWIGIIFIMVNFGFASSLYNGLRIGCASSFFILAISYIPKNSRNWFLTILFLFISYSFHKSIILTIGSLAIARILIKNINISVIIWIICVLLSLLFGDFFEVFLIDLAIDDRLNGYLATEASIDDFAYVGFRWDFLIYSIIGIAWCYYIIVFRKTKSTFFTLLANTYILANSFWVLVIRANFSNRFASLSWLMMPLIFCYPFLRTDYGDDNEKQCSYMLLAIISFSTIMKLLGK